MRKGDTISWAAYSDECLRVIETQNELASDALLVQQVKLRLISERVRDTPWSSAVTQDEDSASPPTTVYIKSLERQLQAFKSGIPVELLENSKYNLSHQCLRSTVRILFQHLSQKLFSWRSMTRRFRSTKSPFPTAQTYLALVPINASNLYTLASILRAPVFPSSWPSNRLNMLVCQLQLSPSLSTSLSPSTASQLLKTLHGTDSL